MKGILQTQPDPQAVEEAVRTLRSIFAHANNCVATRIFFFFFSFLRAGMQTMRADSRRPGNRGTAALCSGTLRRRKSRRFSDVSPIGHQSTIIRRSRTCCDILTSTGGPIRRTVDPGGDEKPIDRWLQQM